MLVSSSRPFCEIGVPGDPWIWLESLGHGYHRDAQKGSCNEGRISAERLVDLVVDLCRQTRSREPTHSNSNQRIEELEKKLGGSATAKVSEPFSLRAEEQRQEARGKKRRKRKRQGRAADHHRGEVAQAVRTEKAFPRACRERLLAVAHAAGVAAGERPSGAGGL